MDQRFLRFSFLVGEEAVEHLRKCHVAVFGIGGVGSFTAESLVRAGIGEITLVDYDTVDVTNINRQLHALETTVGQIKVNLMADRLKAINPNIIVHAINEMYLPEKADDFFKNQYDYVVDAVDMVTAKIDLVLQCQGRKIPLIACMGTGNKLDPTMLKIGDIFETSVCPLARVMRKELKNRGIRAQKVVYSLEQPIQPIYPESTLMQAEKMTAGRKYPPGSTSFVPSSAGLLLASAVVNDLIKPYLD